MYLLLRFLAMSSKDIDVGLPDVGPSGLGLDEVVPGGVKVGTRLGMTTRSMARGVDNDGIIDPEDSVSNLGSRASCTSVLSEAQIEIQRQMETNRIMADLRLAKLAREGKGKAGTTGPGGERGRAQGRAGLKRGSIKG